MGHPSWISWRMFGMLAGNLRVVFPGYQQEPSPPLVRHDELRESGEGAEVSYAQKKKSSSWP